MLLPNKVSCSVSKCVSSDNSFPSVRQEPTLRPWKGVPLPATASYLNMVSSWPERSRPWFHEVHIQWIKVFLKEKTSWLHYYTIEKNQHRSASLATQFSSVAQSCLTLCDPMDCSMPRFPVHHQLSELAQTHVHQVGDAIQPSHHLSAPFSCLQSFPASGSFPMSSSHQVAKVWSFSFSISPSNEY